MVSTAIWVTGLVLMAGALGFAFAGPVTSVVAVGAVLFFTGVAADYWGLVE
jgi:hypothetical protein